MSILDPNGGKWGILEVVGTCVLIAGVALLIVSIAMQADLWFRLLMGFLGGGSVIGGIFILKKA